MSHSLHGNERIVDEETALLATQKCRKATPLPWFQISIILLLQVAEPITSLPLMGGTLSRPAERFPKTFGGKFWKDYPYFLPSLATSSFVVFAFAVTLLFFKESVPKKRFRSSSASDSTSVEHTTNDGHISLSKILIYPVVISISNYMSLAFLNISLNALFPLFMAMPLAIGGLGFSPATIGYIMGCYGVCTGVFQALYFAKIISPSKRSLGATNGLSQTAVSIVRAVGPAMATSLFSVSAEHRLLGGYAVYAILFAFSCVAILLALCLPREMWEEASD
ncbi:hypothetical protein H0H87_010936 [Tephrocybe sp. NHM501043]|nr:hypothetical protein H0H87_010936 [Tephrocybe sp. NHM501043]